MELDVGFVCGSCETFAPFSARACPCCGVALEFQPPEDTGSWRRDQPSPSKPGSALEGLFGDVVPNPSATFKRADLFPEKVDVPSPPEKIFVGPVKIPARFAVSEALMDQARSYVCKKCYSPVPQGHKFCGRCGEPVPREVLTAQTLLLSKMLEPGKAKLVVIKGEGFQADPSDETAFLLGGRHHPAGRTQGDILFDRDNWVSPLHATFYYRDDGKLMIRDEASLNGVFVRTKGTTTIQPGDVFLAGEQVFRVDTTPRASDGNDPDGTQFYSSPKRPSPFRLVQILRGGVTATQVCAREASVSVGREGCDMNFPNDPYMSTRHCKVELTASGAYQLTDTGSKNGTYLAIHGERELGHGDYLFIGRELLRVDISA